MILMAEPGDQMKKLALHVRAFAAAADSSSWRTAALTTLRCASTRDDAGPQLLRLMVRRAKTLAEGGPEA
jgi:hypothetical protein